MAEITRAAGLISSKSQVSAAPIQAVAGSVKPLGQPESHGSRGDKDRQRTPTSTATEAAATPGVIWGRRYSPLRRSVPNHRDTERTQGRRVSTVVTTCRPAMRQPVGWDAR